MNQVMMIRMIKNGKILLLCTFFSFTYAQQQLPDFQLRISPSVDYKFSKKWQASLEYRYALDHDVSEFRNSAIEGGIAYDITKAITVEARYRFTTAFDEDSHLLYGVLKYKKEFNKRFSLKSSTRYQFKTGSFDPDYMQYFQKPTQLLREKVALEYNVPKSKASLYIAPEVFLKVNDKDNPFFSYNAIRYNAGIDYALNYGNTVGLGFFYEDIYNPKKTDRFVFTTKYNLSIDDMLKKIKRKRDEKNGIEFISKKEKKKLKKKASQTQLDSL
ncbi:DUF2490 domain-containing protein [Flavobacterium sp.]